jgi:transcriptional regulator with XRE-family HTH domain
VNRVKNQEFIIAFGKHLRSVRKSKNISMEKLAHEAGIEYSQVSDIELGKINTTISTVYTIAKALDVESKLLFEFSV